VALVERDFELTVLDDEFAKGSLPSFHCGSKYSTPARETDGAKGCGCSRIASVAAMPIRAVTFDFWNTIAREPPGTINEAREAAVAAACESGEVAVEAELLRESLAEVGRRHEESWSRGLHFGPRQAAEALVAALGVEGAARETIAEAFLTAGRGAELALAPEIGPTLERLRADGVALGIVCDAGFTGGAILREFLDREGLLEHFGGWGFSDEVGAYKPAPEIFAAALSALGAEPADALHVGDLRRTDVAGARAFGMRTVRYRGVADDPDPGAEADFVLDDHRDLPPLVAGLA
jgi:putative hydrolase of the HAD superfamily